MKYVYIQTTAIWIILNIQNNTITVTLIRQYFRLISASFSS